MKARGLVYCVVMIVACCVLSAGVAFAAAIQAPNITLFGNNAGALNTGLFVTFIGDSAGFSNSGTDNTFVGDVAGQSNTIGEENTFMGSLAGGSNTEGNFNTFMGAFTGSDNTIGSDNTFIGDEAGFSFIDGKENTFVGSLAGSSNIDGDGNVFLGFNAGSSETGSNKLYIDNCLGFFDTGTCPFPLIYGEFDNRIVAIDGNLGIGTASPVEPVDVQGDGVSTNVRLTKFGGNPGAVFRAAGGTAAAPSQVLANGLLGGFVAAGYTSGGAFSGNKVGIFFKAAENFTATAQGTYLTIETAQKGGTTKTEKLRVSDNGNVGIGTTNPTNPLQMGSGAFVSAGGVWTNASSREYKENIRELTTAEAVRTLEGLNPVKYNYKADATDRHVGFIAEDVPDLVATKDRKGLSPMDIVAVLTKVVQEKSQVIESQQKALEEQCVINKGIMEKLSKLEAEVTRLKSKDITARAIAQ